MLRSWTRRLRIESDYRVGIALSQSMVCVAVVDATAEQPIVCSIRQGSIEQSLFTPGSVDSDGNLLQKSIMPIVGELKEKPYPVHVSVPDTAVRAVTFELDELPKTRSTLHSLARWRMSNELGRSENDLECQVNVMGTDRGKHLIYVQAGDRYWLDKVRSTLTACGIMPWVMNSASFYRFNHLHDEGLSRSSAMISIYDDCWTLQVWDDANRIRLTVTRIRKIPQGHDEIASIANEINRVLRAWLITHPDYKVDKLYLTGRKAEVESIMSAHIHPELFCEIITVDATNIMVGNKFNETSPLASLAIMAACIT